jgi:hypothetical protein
VSHRRWRRALQDLVDGELDLAELRRVKAHLAECPSCRCEHAEIERLVRALADLSGSAPPEGLADRMVGRVRAGEAEPSWTARSLGRFSAALDGPWGAPLATAGLGLVLLVVVQSVQVEIRLPGSGSPPPAETGLQAASTLGPNPVRTRPAPLPTRPGSGALLAARHRNELAPAPAPTLEVTAPASRATCLKRPQLEGCRHLHAWLVGLALHDTSAFLAEIDAVPRKARDRWLGEVSRFAQSSGSAPVLAQRLRATPDPRASRLAPRFERIAAYAGR